MFEVVHTLDDWWDGPRKGIADYQAKPHLFMSEWRDDKDDDSDTYLLTPIDSATFELALEAWFLWREWETAYHQGKVSIETHPASSKMQDRHWELNQILKDRLVTDPQRAVRKSAEFRVRDDPTWSGYGSRPLEVCWKEPSSNDSSEA